MTTPSPRFAPLGISISREAADSKSTPSVAVPPTTSTVTVRVESRGKPLKTAATSISRVPSPSATEAGTTLSATEPAITL